MQRNGWRLAAVVWWAVALLPVAAYAEKGASTMGGGAASSDRCIVKIGGKAVSGRTHAIVIPARPTAQEKHAAEQQSQRGPLGEPGN